MKKRSSGSIAWFAALALSLAVFCQFGHAQDVKQTTTGDKATSEEAAKKPNSRIDEFAEMSFEKLNDITKKGKETLDTIIKGDESDLDRSMRELQEIVCAAAERARRLSNWDIKQIESEAEKAFDDTIAAIEAYLDFVKDDGAIHQASKRIRTAALEKERVFREKAEAKDSDRYKELAAAMHNQAEKASAAWDAIRKERKNAEEAVKELKEYRELYVDVKAAQGIGEAVKELEAVRDDLIKLSQAMRKVQEAVLREAKKTADDLSAKPVAK